MDTFGDVICGVFALHRDLNRPADNRLAYKSSFLFNSNSLETWRCHPL